MKNVILSIITFIALISCKEQNVIGPMTLSGKIENPKSDSISILDQTGKVIHTIKIAKGKNTFVDTFSITKGYYYLLIGDERTNAFLKPAFNLNLELNTKSFDESLVYKGKGANENNYLAKKSLFEESLGKFNSASYVYNLNEEKYLNLVDSLYNFRVNRLKNSQTKLDKDFKFWELKNYELQRLYQISGFETAHQFFTNNKGFKVSTQYPDPFKYLDINNEQLLMSPYYLMLIDGYIHNEAQTKIKNNDSSDMNLEILNVVGNDIKSQKVRESISRQIGRQMLDYTKELDKVYEKLTGFIGDKKSLNDLNTRYKKLKKIQKGNISPDFSFHDINNQTVTLGSLKGKLVYIDIWATWCAPCIVEIPALKQLEKDLNDRNIQFVSICGNDNKASWLKTIKEKELGGIQIYTRADSSSFFDDYLVSGIPKYILLDKNGYIIDSNAKRPTDPKLKEELLALLHD